MRSFNLRYRGIDRATDVLSFPQDISDSSKDKRASSDSRTPERYDNELLGDIVICVPSALSQARESSVPFYDELLRLMIHGLLHLIGYDHEKGGAEKTRMIKKEKELFCAVKTMA